MHQNNVSVSGESLLGPQTARAWRYPGMKRMPRQVTNRLDLPIALGSSKAPRVNPRHRSLDLAPSTLLPPSTIPYDTIRTIPSSSFSSFDLYWLLQ